jgi:hypothetical protein
MREWRRPCSRRPRWPGKQPAPRLLREAAAVPFLAEPTNPELVTRTATHQRHIASERTRQQEIRKMSAREAPFLRSVLSLISRAAHLRHDGTAVQLKPSFTEVGDASALQTALRRPRPAKDCS